MNMPVKPRTPLHSQPHVLATLPTLHDQFGNVDCTAFRGLYESTIAGGATNCVINGTGTNARLVSAPEIINLATYAADFLTGSRPVMALYVPASIRDAEAFVTQISQEFKQRAASLVLLLTPPANIKYKDNKLTSYEFRRRKMPTDAKLLTGYYKQAAAALARDTDHTIWMVSSYMRTDVVLPNHALAPLASTKGIGALCTEEGKYFDKRFAKGFHIVRSMDPYNLLHLSNKGRGAHPPILSACATLAPNLVTSIARRFLNSESIHEQMELISLTLGNPAGQKEDLAAVNRLAAMILGDSQTRMVQLLAAQGLVKPYTRKRGKDGKTKVVDVMDTTATLTPDDKAFLQQCSQWQKTQPAPV